MTDDPVEREASVNTTGPTREEVAKTISSYRLHINPNSPIAALPSEHAIASAIIALYAPALAKLEKERDEARHVALKYATKLDSVSGLNLEDMPSMQSALASAKAEGMREAAGIAYDARNAETNKPGSAWDASRAILAATPKEM